MAKLEELVFIFIFISISISIQAIISSSLKDSCKKPPKPVVLFIFGDSLFDHGNNNYIKTSILDQANFQPYGETYYLKPTGRFSDGRLITDYITDYAGLQVIPPYLQPNRSYEVPQYGGVSFASAGSGLLGTTFKGYAISMKKQLKHYEKEVSTLLRRRRGDPEAAAIPLNAVYMMSTGTSDYLSPILTDYTILESYSPSEYVSMVIGNLSAVVNELYRKGARKFLFLTLGNLGVLPGIRIKHNSNGPLEEASNLANLHNEALHKLLLTLGEELKDFKFFLYDFKTSLALRMNKPADFDFEDGESACCGSGRAFNGEFTCGRDNDYSVCDNPKKFVFWDSYQLTERAYEQMADEMWGSDCLKKLFLCL